MIESIIIGIIQGLTEFFPVSSSGHIIIAEKLLGYKEGDHNFAAAIHLATALAAIIYFRKDIWKIIKGMLYLPNSCTSCRRLGWKIIAATIPVIIVGYILEQSSLIEKIGSNILLVGIALVVFGVLLYFTDQLSVKRQKSLSSGKVSPEVTEGVVNINEKEEPTLLDSILIGSSQLIAAVLPGASRSGVSFTTSFWRGIKREEATKFVFLISIPATAIPGLYEIFIKKNLEVNTEFSLAFISAFVSGLFAIYFLFKLIKQSSLKWFCYYRIVLGIGIILYSLFIMK